MRQLAVQRVWWDTAAGEIFKDMAGLPVPDRAVGDRAVDSMHCSAEPLAGTGTVDKNIVGPGLSGQLRAIEVAAAAGLLRPHAPQ